MKEVFMCASIITAIILCFIGILKLPFKTFKSKHPKSYRAVFCILSLGLSIAGPILCQLYILNASLYSIDFAVLIATTIGGVFGLYTSYEGLGLKTLVKVLVEKVSQLLTTYNDSKLTKMVGKVGIEKLEEIAGKIKAEEFQKAIAEQPVVQESAVQPAPQATQSVAQSNEIKF